MRHLLLLTLATAGLALAGCETTPTAHPLPPACDQKPDAGNGQADMTGFYYDKDSEQCKSFTYGDGATVPFQTLDVCMAACYAPAPDLMPDNADNTSPRTERVQ